MATALSGIRVAAFTHFAAGPIAAQYLGSFGADVIKVESPQQDVNRYAIPMAAFKALARTTS